ncbi:MAG: transposase [Elusimicrobia bacterium]|nr:transposase [Elusimicrobiota bacterium]
MRSDRKLIMELKCNMTFRWFVGLDISSEVWDDSTFSKNQEHWFDKSDVLERLFDDTVKTAMQPRCWWQPSSSAMASALPPSRST